MVTLWRKQKDSWIKQSIQGLEPEGTQRLLSVNPDDDPLKIDFSDVQTIVLHMPTFKDGQAISQARCLRERGYANELMIRGDIRSEQLEFIGLCGIDAIISENELNAPTTQDLGGFYLKDLLND